MTFGTKRRPTSFTPTNRTAAQHCIEFQEDGRWHLVAWSTDPQQAIKSAKKVERYGVRARVLYRQLTGKDSTERAEQLGIRV